MCWRRATCAIQAPQPHCATTNSSATGCWRCRDLDRWEKALRSASLGFAITLTAIAANPARAAGPVLKEATDLAGFAMFIASGAPGMVLAVTRGSDSIVLGYGETE